MALLLLPLVAAARTPVSPKVVTARQGLEKLRQIAREPNGFKPTKDGKSCIVHDEITSKVIVVTRGDRRDAGKMLDLLVKRVKRKSREDAPTWIGIHAAAPLAQKIGKEGKLLGAAKKALANHFGAAKKALGGWRRQSDPERLKRELAHIKSLVEHVPEALHTAILVELNRGLERLSKKLGHMYQPAASFDEALAQTAAW